MKNIHIILSGILFFAICFCSLGCGSSGGASETMNTPQEQEVIDAVVGYLSKFLEGKESVKVLTSESFNYIYGANVPTHGNYGNYCQKLDEFYSDYVMLECRLDDAVAISCEDENAMVGGRIYYGYQRIGLGEESSNSENIEIGLIKEGSNWVVNSISGRNSSGIDFPIKSVP